MNLFISAREKFMEDYQKQVEKEEEERDVGADNQLNQAEDTKRLK
ncbi:hypothetical protein OZL92_00760 [Bacillus sonorensis]|uniref:Uncharacterized protein n=2 Tax=Bacillus sonorensis TaxID=119858 RepID=M5PFF3_9BACI|nr:MULTISPECIES: hypothetical protein [Bacillus]TWK77207.1 hypothetical protein CHCC20335_0464 [Bacillus paralicheniformis]ASB87903.1 hypothetical protein S101395_01393 [Bacillus sonorensis]EME75332.1 hypothetical protein BSONL12_10112 [Bacillus sonorensis L12]MCZ0066963.1 hypothetical protein [Bacillus sonorensis]MCZ0071305.1 hypothetical protein [Bacillus sonorensis]